MRVLYSLSLAKVVLAVAAALVLGAVDARAHSFRTVFLAPMTGAEAAVGKAALDGFMVATRERDGHPAETADGHLGGLDVHVTVIDTALDPAATAQQVRVARPDILAGRMTPAVDAAIRGMSDAVPVGPVDEGGETTTMDGEPFAEAFRTEYGYDVTLAAIIGYRQARRIDRAVRAMDGDVSNRAAVAAALQHAPVDGYQSDAPK